MRDHEPLPEPEGRRAGPPRVPPTAIGTMAPPVNVAAGAATLFAGYWISVAVRSIIRQRFAR